MSIGIEAEHVELAASLRSWAEGLDGPGAARAAEGDAGARFPDVWKAVTEMGVAAIGLPEAAGGGGGSLLDVAVALEACASALLPGPLLGTSVAARLLADHPVAADVVDDVVGGAVVGLVLDGVVWDAPSATHLLLPLGDGGAWGVLPAGAASVQPAAGLDLTRRLGSLARADLATAEPVPGLTTDGVRRLALTLAAAEASGVARWCLATAVEHALVREQFGRPIGAFQAVKHLCAEMAAELEPARALLWYAGYALDEALPDARLTSLHAKAYLAEASRFVSRGATEVHGGMGITDALGLHYWFKRNAWSYQAFGSPERLREEAAALQDRA